MIRTNTNYYLKKSHILLVNIDWKLFCLKFYVNIDWILSETDKY